MSNSKVTACHIIMISFLAFIRVTEDTLPNSQMMLLFLTVSVAVSVWTLVAISLERYYAICQPLQSRLWQTMNHAYRVIVIVWLLSLLTMLPIAVISKLIPMRTPGKVKCREVWPNKISEKSFNVLLDVLLLIAPLVLLLVAYFQIIATLREGLKNEFQEKSCKASGIELKENKRKNSIQNSEALNTNMDSSYQNSCELKWRDGEAGVTEIFPSLSMEVRTVQKELL
ncbi:Cholecystokinin receptor [Nymphon striatum]|nr:Cholecystokinin receptor [Nymphon striatum]